MSDEQAQYNTGTRQLPKAADPYEALHDYLGSVMLYADIAQDYTRAHDIAGMSHAIRSLLAYAKAVKGELAAIIEQAIDEAGRATEPAAAAPKTSEAEDEWWNK
jgi:hypothetical protein